MTSPLPSPSARLKLTYGAGQIADSIGLNGVKQIGNTFYVVVLGVSPAWIGTLLALIRLWDAFTDPWVGRISDRLVSRHGRRKPLMLGGAIAMALLFPLLWLASPDWSAAGKTAWFAGTLLLFYVGYTFYSVPFQAMGLELARDYHQRTSVQAYRTFFGASSNIILWWALPLAFLPFFGGGVAGMRWVGVAIAGVIFVAALGPLLARTGESAAPTLRETASAGWRTVVTNRPFCLLVATMGLTFLGINLAYGMAGLLNVYLVYRGEVAASMVVTGAFGTAWTVASIVATPAVARLSRHTGKRVALSICIGAILLGSLLYRVAFDPAHPFLQLVPVFLISPGVAGLWILGPSMLADVCDDDLLRHAVRREATFSAVYAWVQKLSLSLSFALSGYLTVATGFDTALGAAQGPGVFDAMRWLLAGAPAVALVPALLLLARYPLSEDTVRRNRAMIESRAIPSLS